MSDSINENIADEIRAHAIDFERFAADVARRVLELLLALEVELVRKIRDIDPTEPTRKAYRDARLAKLLEQTRASIREGYKAVNKTTDADLIQVAELTSTATVTAVNTVVGVELMTVAMGPEKFRALVDNSMIEGAPSKQWWSKQAGDTVFRFQRAVQMGYAQNESIEEIVRRVRGTRGANYQDGFMQGPRRHAAALVHSSVQAVSNSARLEVFKNSGDILTGYLQISTLDSRTTEICRGYSGKRWLIDGTPDGHHLPFNGGPPRHWNSLAAGSIITTARGSVPIEEVRIGDQVLTHRGRFQPVYATMSKRCETGIVRVIRTESGREIRATDEHPILSFVHGWKRADEIQVGDQLFEDADDTVGIEPFLVVVGAADNYPAPLHEEQVFSSILVASAMVPAAVHFQDDVMVRESEIPYLLTDNELMDEIGFGLTQDIEHGLLALGNIKPMAVCNDIGSNEPDVLQLSRVVFQHPSAVSGVDGAVILGHAPSPVVFSSHLVFGITSVEAGTFRLGSGLDLMTPTPSLKNSLANADFSFNLPKRLLFPKMLSADQVFDNASIFEVDRPPFASAGNQELGLRHDLDAVSNAGFMQSSHTQIHPFVEDGEGVTRLPMMLLDEGCESDRIVEVNREHWVLSRVVSVECSSYTKTVHNIAVATDETYVANGITVHNCRSVLVAWMKDIDDLPDGTRRKIPEATQASMDGQVPADLDYNEWLKTKGDKFAREVMGEGKFNLWKAGKITQSDLLDQSGNPLTLAELREKFG